jgi:8-oxo-dGTP pyrophosphatase MutT (NUDIX family)
VTPPAEHIRNIAVGLVVRDGHALVEVYPATDRHGEFARAIGGGIEFGETAADAVRREFEEELGVVLTTAEPIAVTENLFEIGGRPGHEVVHVFAVSGPQLEGLPMNAELRVLDNHTTVRWLSIEALRADDPPFYPYGMIALADGLGAAADR